MEDEEEIKRRVEEYFKNLFKEDRPVRPKVDGLNLP